MKTATRKTELEELLTRLDLSIDNLELLDLALTHSSYNFENKTPEGADNERLEFLGDAVLKIIASRYLFERFPNYSEGELTKIMAILVSDKMLTKFAEKINLGKYLKIGFHEEKQGGRNRASTLACAFEAFLAAFYLDDKIADLTNFLQKLIKEVVSDIDSSASKHNFKAMLQEYSQANDMGIPKYTVIKEEGPDHNKLFIVQAILEGKIYGEGQGKSKKEAHKYAAELACIKLGLIEKGS